MKLNLVGEPGTTILAVVSVTEQDSVAVVPNRYTRKLPARPGMRFSSRMYDALELGR